MVPDRPVAGERHGDGSWREDGASSSPRLSDYGGGRNSSGVSHRVINRRLNCRSATAHSLFPRPTHMPGLRVIFRYGDCSPSKVL
ncbi:hypothetical protein OH76DRAFT_1395095 [Lentinus brumalis]|uniref:Uncharacterized protein n=1 Tax=Lentinus brumalis TaxID=2498619 RepID=A0A371DXM2_9APHY|nr:hypothetical protein OH76DRAFT_1395095 [Polyporus brumalis]